MTQGKRHTLTIHFSRVTVPTDSSFQTSTQTPNVWISSCWWMCSWILTQHNVQSQEECDQTFFFISNEEKKH